MLKAGMWELIRANRRKSLVLFLIIGLLLLATGYVVGRASLPDQDGGVIGVLLAALVWMCWSIISYIKGNAIIMYMNHARRVTPSMYPRLHNVLEEMKLAANLPALPALYVVDDLTPNAFATGRSPKKSAVAVTTGLMKILNRDELQGVIAHEVSHILNRDSLYMTFAGLMLGTINIFSQGFLWGLWHGAARSRVRFRGRRGGRVGTGTPFMVFAVIFALLAPVMTRIFYFSLSRKKEYLADATAIRLTRYPPGLANALAKISGSRTELSFFNATTLPMYIVQPFVRDRKLRSSGLFATHPPVEKRIKILRSITTSVDYDTYQRSFSRVSKGTLIPPSLLNRNRRIAVRPPGPQEKLPNRRDLGDLVRASNGFIFITCLCGLKIKLPPGFRWSEFECPRCSRHIKIPAKKMAALMALLARQRKEKANQAPDPLTYKRKGGGWESFACERCGKICQLSPAFAGKMITCRGCQSVIKIV